VVSLFADAVQVRTLFIRRYFPIIARLQCVIPACELVLLVLESWPKTRWVLPAEVPYSPEDLSGILRRIVYFWLNPLLLKGNPHIISIDDISPYVDAKLDPSRANRDFNIFVVLVQILGQMVPRLGVTGFSYSQTFLINVAVNYLDTPLVLRKVNHAYGLIGATVRHKRKIASR
jgi:ATP-binding cassette subfamily C (CFTR/MRP) protein 1